MTDIERLRHDHHGCRLCARQRAEAADRIEELEAALNECVKAQGWQPETRPSNFTKLDEGPYD